MKEVIHIDHLPGRTIQVEGKEYLYCSGTSYLGMAKNEAFSIFLQEGMARYGTNYSSSRISNLQLQVYEEAESYLAHLAGAQAAITLSSGFLTGQMVIRLQNKKANFVYAPRTHPAVWRSAEDFFDGDFDAWVLQVLELIVTSSETDFIIVCNSLDPLLAKRYDFSWLTQLPANKNITLLIDDSHGFGIIGKEGTGIFSELTDFQNIHLIVISSFGKAFGVPGGVVLSDKRTIDSFKKNPFFGGSSPVIPAYLYAFLQSEIIYKKEREKLFTNIRHFKNLVSNLGIFNYFTDYPVFYTPENKLCSYLKENGVLISSFPYPSPEDNLITRVVINSLHTQEDINKVAKSIAVFTTVK